MTIIVLTDCPPRLRGDLTKWLMEINTGVYVGNLNPRVRDVLWERVCDHVKSGRATMVYRAGNEQHMQFRVHNTTWEPVDFDGLTLMRRPLPQSRGLADVMPPMMKAGFSNAAHQQKARQMAKRRPPMTTYTVIDVETTGLDPLSADIIEIAALHVADGAPVREFSQLIRIDHPLPSDIVSLTGITDTDLQEHGRLLRQVLADLQEFIGETTLISHHSAFDQRFLTAACHRVGCTILSNHFIDTLALARRKVMGVPNYKLTTLAAHLGITVQHPHRALADCHATHLIFSKLNEN